MNKRAFLQIACCLAFFGQAAVRLHAETASPVEKEKIENLLARAAILDGGTFIFNDEEYTPKAAADYLRGMWKSNEGEIATALEFITKAGTGTAATATTESKPYIVRFKSGKEIPCASYLSYQLKKLEAVAADQPKPGD